MRGRERERKRKKYCNSKRLHLAQEIEFKNSGPTFL
jgi:hypothetical protein